MRQLWQDPNGTFAGRGEQMRQLWEDPNSPCAHLAEQTRQRWTDNCRAAFGEQTRQLWQDTNDPYAGKSEHTKALYSYRSGDWCLGRAEMRCRLHVNSSISYRYLTT